MTQGPVLPMRFGSILADDGSVRELLDASRNAFVAALHGVRGAVEVGLRAAWEPDAVTDDGSGTAYLMGRLDRNRRAKALADRIDGPLEQLARGSERRLLPGRGALLRSAYLVDRKRLDDFRARVQELDDEIDEAQIVCTGPWPPYSFASLGKDS